MAISGFHLYEKWISPVEKVFLVHLQKGLGDASPKIRALEGASRTVQGLGEKGSGDASPKVQGFESQGLGIP